MATDGFALGATVTGVELNRPLSAEDFAGLRSALAEHQVLAIHGQNISHENHRDLGAGFGPLMRHPAYPAVAGFPDIIVLDNDRENPSKIDEWHIDMSFTPNPPLGSILVAEEGINGVLAGNMAALDAFEHALQHDAAFDGCFAGIAFKRSACTTAPFARMKVHRKPEIVQLGVDEVNLP